MSPATALPRPRPLSRSGARRAALAFGAALVALGTLGAVPPAQARELFWRSIDVVARVEADGSFSVAETQAMVMSGDWNGGERVLRVGPGQSVRVERIVRIDSATGAETLLQKGKLDRVDRWDWSDSSTLRWRSRLPSDPPFDQTLLVYRLELVYERVFADLGGGRYELSHDFAFSDRVGAIERFSLELDAEPGWELPGALQVDGAAKRVALPARFEAGPLPPGRGFVVQGALAWRGAEAPANASAGRPSIATAGALAGALAVAAMLFGVLWWRRDAALGRFAPGPDPRAIDAAWLEEKLFSMKPEIVGAAWDRSIGNAEVAAILARLVGEKRLGSRVERKGWGPFGRDVLHLELLVPRSDLDGDEQALISGLFPFGDSTDTERLRAHYSSKGFDPVAKIRGRLGQRLQSVPGFGKAPPRPSKKPTVFLLLAGVGIVVLAAVTRPGAGLAFLGIGGALLASLPGLAFAGAARSKVRFPAVTLAAIAVSTGLCGLVLRGLGGLATVPALALVGVALFAAGLVRAMFQTLSSPESELSMATRRELHAARRFFAVELRKDAPRLEDRWFPWLVALGLAPECDRWARRFGVAGATGVASSSRGSWGSGSPGGGGTGSGGGWSGGGGSFGGAGATASFASAVSTMAAGVPTPSSSGGSGGGGGGGGSSSGGGGGGGW